MLKIVTILPERRIERFSSQNIFGEPRTKAETIRPATAFILPIKKELAWKSDALKILRSDHLHTVKGIFNSSDLNVKYCKTESWDIDGRGNFNSEKIQIIQDKYKLQTFLFVKQNFNSKWQEINRLLLFRGNAVAPLEFSPEKMIIKFKDIGSVFQNYHFKLIVTGTLRDIEFIP